MNFKRFISGIIALSVVVSAVHAPSAGIADMAAFAETSPAGDNSSVQWKCGKTATMTITDGVAHVSGTGIVYNYNETYEQPWKSMMSEIHTLTVDEGITRLGDNMFDGASALSTVILPSTLERIGFCTFHYCSALDSVILPSSLTLIRSGAFLNSGVRTIRYTGSEAQWEALRKEDLYIVEDGVSFIFGTAAGRAGDTTMWLNDPDSDTLLFIGKGAVADQSEGKAPWLDMPDRVSKVLFGEGIDSIGKYAFAGAKWLESAGLDGIRSVGESAFADCPSVSRFLLPDDLFYIGKDAFSANPDVRVFCTPDSTADKAAKAAGISCDAISGTCGPSLAYSYNSTDGALTVFGSGKMTDYSDLSQRPWNDVIGDIRKVYIIDNVTNIGKNAFNGASSLTAADLGSVTGIGEQSFANCPNLHALGLPETVRTVDGSAFYDDSALEHLIVPKSLRSAGNGAFFLPAGSDGTCVYYSGTAQDWESIDKSSDNTLLESDNTAFGCISGKYSSLISWVFLPESGTLRIIGDGDMPAAAAAPWSEFADKITSVELTGHISSVGDGTFAGLSALRSVALSDDVRSIGKNAFNGCGKLSSVTMSGSLDSIGDSAFADCTSLTGITLPATARSIGDSAFSGCTALSYIKLPESIGSVGSHAFFHCESLNEIFVESPDAEYGDKAFGYSTENRRKSDVQLITFAGSSAEKFASDNGIQLVSVRSGDTCGKDVVFTFDSDSGVLSVYGRGDTFDYNNGSNKAPWNAGGYISDIREVRFSSGITRIGSSFMQGAKNLSAVTLPDRLSSVGTQAFRDCAALGSLRFPDTLDTIGRNAFYGAASLSRLFFEGDAPVIEGDAAGAHRQFIDSYGTEIYAHFTKNGWDSFRENSGIRDDVQIIDLDTVSTYDKLTITNVPEVINVGDEVQLNIDIDPRIASEFIWQSSSPECIQVSNHGLLTAFSAGEAEITVHSRYNSDISFSFMITAQDKSGLSTAVKVQSVLLSGKTPVNNASANNYNYFTTFATKLVNSYLTQNADGSFTRLENVDNSYILIEDYDKDLNLTSSRTMDMQLHHMLGYYHGKDGHHYFLFGQDNDGKYSQPAMDDELEVYRMVRYNSDWSDPVSVKVDNTGLSAVSLKDLSNGVARMAESDKYLYVTTARTVYQGHQENLVLVFNKDTMERIYDSAFYTRVSHSFNGFIDTAGDYIYLADHGDYNPRAVMVQRFPKNIFNMVSNRKLNVFDITVPDHPVYGDNYTGVTVGGFAATDSSTLLVGTSIDQSLTEVDDQTQHNVFCSVTDNALSEVKTVWLTSYKQGSGTVVYTPQMVKLSNNQFLVMWEEVAQDTGNVSTMIAVIDQNGQLIGQPEKTSLRLSDCQPFVAEDGTVMWYVTDDMAPVVYKLNPYSLEKADTDRISYSFDADTSVLRISGKGNIPNYTKDSARDWIKQSGADPDKVKTIIFDGDIHKIGDNAFSGLDSLEQVIISSHTYNIGNSSFADCPQLRDVSLPDTLRTIGSGAFDGDKLITRLIIPDSVEKADFGWMYAAPGTDIYYTGSQENWDKLTSDLHNSTKELKNIITSAVSGKCGESAQFVLDPASGQLIIYGSGSVAPAKEKEFPWSKYADGITSVRFTEGITSVPDNAFLDAGKLSTIILPESLTSVGENSFAGCSANSRIITRPQLSSISKNAFGADSGLAPRKNYTVYGQKGSAAEKYAADTGLSFRAVEGYCGDELAWYFDSKSGTLNIVGSGDMYDYDNKKQPWYELRDKMTSVALPDGISRIGSNAFCEFNKINNIIIPQSVREIGPNAFYSCHDLDTVTIRSVSYSADDTSFFDGYGKKRDIYFIDTEAQWEKLATESEKTDAVTVHFGADGPPPVTTTTTTATTSTTTAAASTTTTTAATSAVTSASAVKSSTSAQVSTASNAPVNTSAATASTSTVRSSATASSTPAKSGVTATAVKTTTAAAPTSSATKTAATTYKSATSSTALPVPMTSTTPNGSSGKTTASASSATKSGQGTSTTLTTTASGSAPVTTSSSPADHGYLFGDVNFDGKVDAADASDILMAYAANSVGKKPELNDIQMKIADIDGNGIADASDATQVLRYYSYLSTGGTLSFIEFLK